MRTLRQKLLYVLVTSSVVVLLIVASSRYKADEGEESYSKLLMGTVVELTLSGPGGVDYDLAAFEAFAEIERLEAIFSSYRPTSEVSKISRSAGKGPVTVSPEVASVVETAIRIAKLSSGAFDPTIGALGEHWSFSGGGDKGVPTKERVEELLKLVDYTKITVTGNAVGIGEPGMKLNLGGIAKGYIVGRAVEKLKEHGVERMIVKAGGDMFVSSNDSGAPFEIGITHPREQGRLLGRLQVIRGAITTSGDYERFFIKDNVRYHHILDTETGYPARRSISATITSEDPTLADALSTALFVMGPGEGMEMIESLEGVEGVVVDPGGALHVSSGLRDRFEAIERVDIKGPRERPSAGTATSP